MTEADSSDKPQIAWALATLKDGNVFDQVLAEYKLGHLAKVQNLAENPVFDPEVMAGMVTLDKLATLVGDDSESVRQLVATDLSRPGDAKWTAQLTTLVQDKDIEVAREAAVGLGKIANEASIGPLTGARPSGQRFASAIFGSAARRRWCAKTILAQRVCTRRRIAKNSDETDLRHASRPRRSARW